MVKVQCSQCNLEGLLQRVGNNYFRVRHYDGYDQETKKTKFHYHQISKEYALSQLGGNEKAEHLIGQEAMVKKWSSQFKP